MNRPPNRVAGVPNPDDRWIRLHKRCCNWASDWRHRYSPHEFRPHPQDHQRPPQAAALSSMYGIFTYIYYKNQPHVGRDIPYMDPVGDSTEGMVRMTVTWTPIDFELTLLALEKLWPSPKDKECPAQKIESLGHSSLKQHCQTFHVSLEIIEILLMDRILHHLGCLKPYK